jgi:hypothetical protein
MIDKNDEGVDQTQRCGITEVKSKLDERRTLSARLGDIEPLGAVPSSYLSTVQAPISCEIRTTSKRSETWQAAYEECI